MTEHGFETDEQEMVFQWLAAENHWRSAVQIPPLEGVKNVGDFMAPLISMGAVIAEHVGGVMLYTYNPNYHRIDGSTGE